MIGQGGCSCHDPAGSRQQAAVAHTGGGGREAEGLRTIGSDMRLLARARWGWEAEECPAGAAAGRGCSTSNGEACRVAGGGAGGGGCLAARFVGGHEQGQFVGAWRCCDDPCGAPAPWRVPAAALPGYPVAVLSVIALLARAGVETDRCVTAGTRSRDGSITDACQPQQPNKVCCLQSAAGAAV